MPAVLTSVRNPLLKEIRKAGIRGGPTPDGFCIAESFHLLEEVLRSRLEVKAVIAAESVFSTVERHVRGVGQKVTGVPDALFQEISTTESSQGVMALVRLPEWKIDHLFRGSSLVMALDGVQDPGNAGAIVRAAEAFGATGAFFLRGSASPFHPKTLRASAGSLFRLPFLPGVDEKLAIAAFEQRRLDVYAAIPRAARLLAEADLTRRCAFVIGGETRGVSAAFREIGTELRIPTTQVESLNAAVAAGILLYEARRQRQRPV